MTVSHLPPIDKTKFPHIRFTSPRDLAFRQSLSKSVMSSAGWMPSIVEAFRWAVRIVPVMFLLIFSLWRSSCFFISCVRRSFAFSCSSFWRSSFWLKSPRMAATRDISEGFLFVSAPWWMFTPLLEGKVLR